MQQKGKNEKKIKNWVGRTLINCCLHVQ